MSLGTSWSTVIISSLDRRLRYTVLHSHWGQEAALLAWPVGSAGGAAFEAVNAIDRGVGVSGCACGHASPLAFCASGCSRDRLQATPLGNRGSMRGGDFPSLRPSLLRSGCRPTLHSSSECVELTSSPSTASHDVGTDLRRRRDLSATRRQCNTGTSRRAVGGADRLPALRVPRQCSLVSHAAAPSREGQKRQDEDFFRGFTARRELIFRQ
jgi:hypothetical protein